MPRKERTTADFVIITLTVSVSLLIVVSGLSLVLVEIVHPGADTSLAARTVADIINTVTGALIGFLAGRGSRGDKPLE